MIKYPIYIPSKGRPNAPTAKLLDREKIPFTLVVEPQDLKEYQENWGLENVISTEEDNCGLGQSRNVCKKTSISRGEPWHWQIDDNIQSFRMRMNGKNHKVTADFALGTSEKYADKFENIGLVGLTHVSFAFARKTAVGINKQCSSVVLVNNELDCWWRRNVVEDTDYSMQVLHQDDHYWCTLLLHRLLFQKPAQNSMKGGMSLLRDKSEYRKTAAENLAKFWPGSFTVKVVPDKRLGSKHRVMPSRVWQTFTQRPFTKER